MNLSQLNKILLQTLLLPVVALLLVSGALILQIGDAEGAVAGIQTVDKNIATATLILAQVTDEETGLRGFETTGNEVFLQPYEFATAPLQANVAQLRRDILKQGGDVHSLDAFTVAHREWLNDSARPTISMVRDGKSTRDPTLHMHAKAQMDHVRELLDNVIEEQKAHRQTEVEHWKSQVRHTLAVIIGAAVFIGLGIGLFARSRLHLVTHAFQGALDALRRNAQATYDSEQRLRTILTSIGEGVIVCDQDGRIEMLNTVAEQLTGWKQSEVFHHHITEAFHVVDESTRELLENPIAAALRTRHTVSLPNQAVLLRRDGSELYIDESGSPLFDHHGVPSGVVMVIRDVTEQRRTQTALLSSEKLAVAGRLAATLAHEIHNPLDSVVNLLYLMKTGATPEETSEFLDMARAELDRVTQISRAMLGMYRESRTPISIDLKDLLESVILLLQRQLSQAGVQLRNNLKESTIVTGYPAELRQVFTNLLTNGADASSSGGLLEVSLCATPAVRSPGMRELRPAGATVCITDHGPGIAPEILNQLFQPFFTTKGEKGTGLGLWVSQGIVQKHGGDIHLDTRTGAEDHGTTVTIFLPRGAPSGPEQDGHTTQA